MIIVSFNDIADVPPQNVRPDVLSNMYQNCLRLVDEVPYDDLTTSLMEWELDLFCNSNNVNEDWYTRALVCICLRGIRGDSRPNILNISE